VVTAIPGVIEAGAKWSLVWQNAQMADGIVGSDDGGLLFASSRPTKSISSTRTTGSRFTCPIHTLPGLWRSARRAGFFALERGVPGYQAAVHRTPGGERPDSRAKGPGGQRGGQGARAAQQSGGRQKTAASTSAAAEPSF